MNAGAIGFIACRLLAIYLVVMHVLAFVVEIPALVLSGLVGSGAGPITVSYAVAIGVYVLLSAFFWFGAGLISRSLSRPFPDKFDGDMDFDRWYALVVAALGALALLTSAQIFGDAFRSFAISHEWSSSPFRGGILFLAAGLSLVMLPRSVVSSLNALRRWGNKPLIEGDKQ